MPRFASKRGTGPRYYRVFGCGCRTWHSHSHLSQYRLGYLQPIPQFQEVWKCLTQEVFQNKLEQGLGKLLTQIQLGLEGAHLVQLLCSCGHLVCKSSPAVENVCGENNVRRHDNCANSYDQQGCTGPPVCQVAHQASCRHIHIYCELSGQLQTHTMLYTHAVSSQARTTLTWQASGPNCMFSDNDNTVKTSE